VAVALTPLAHGVDALLAVVLLAVPLAALNAVG
jgi:hypothetical protein